MGNYSITNLPVGFIVPVINSDNIPLGTLECNGALISKTTYANLWSGTNMSIGSQYGESGGFFRLPDFRGRMPRHISGTSGRDPDAATRYADFPGGPTGNEVGSMQDDLMGAAGSHRHYLIDPATRTVNLNAGNSLSGFYNPIDFDNFKPNLAGVGTAGSASIGQSSGPIGSGDESRSKNFNLKWCIKY